MISALIAVRLCGSLALAQSMDFSDSTAKPAPPAAAPAPQVNDRTADSATGLQSEGVRKARYNEIERGFSIRLPVGMLTYLTPVKLQGANGASKNFGPGMLMGMEIGYDILPVLDIEGFFYFAQTPGTSVTLNDTRDLTTLLGGLMARVSFFHTERVYIGVRGGAGYGIQDNLIEKKQPGVAIVAAATIEYFTRLRHISFALDVGTVIWTSPLSVGLTVVPAVRWTL